MRFAPEIVEIAPENEFKRALIPEIHVATLIFSKNLEVCNKSAPKM